MITAEEAKKHRQSIVANQESWQRIDFERLSDSLSIEINYEMSPIVVRKVIEGRLSEMSVREYDTIGLEIWNYLESIQVLGKFEAVHITNNRKELFPIQLKKLGKESAAISPVGATVSSTFDCLSENPLWEKLSSSESITTELKQDHVLIYGKFLYPWGEKQLVELLRSLDKAKTLPLSEVFPA